MAGFVGRRSELTALKSWWEQSSDRPALVWGRRRVGKTALIQQFSAKLKRVVFHTGAGEPAVAELETLSREVARIFPTDIRDLGSNPYRDWRDALDHLARLAVDKPVLFVIDEFPELMKTSHELPGVLRAFLDHTRGKTQLRLLLCGSAVRTMWSIQEERAPLYGRFNLTLPVYPFQPHEAAAMLPQLRPTDRALVYGLLGGMPLYLAWWRQESSVSDNLLHLAGRPGSPLLTEGRLILLTEVGTGEQAASALYAIAAGKTRHSEIADAIGTDPTRILDRFIETRLIERIVPVTEDSRKSRRKIYRIADNFLAFYLGPLQRYRSEIERGYGDLIVPSMLRHVDNLLGNAYEEAFRSHLWQLARKGELGGNVVAIGQWWNTGGQDEIDAVVLAQPERTRIPVLVGEAKWTKTIDARRILTGLIRKGEALADDATLRYAVCARENVTNADKDVLTITANDIFGTED